MNRLALFSILFLFSFCSKKEVNHEPNTEVIHTQSESVNQADTLWISPESRIFWKGTKMRKLGKHEGELRFDSGYILIDEERPLASYLIADMQTIQVTDIPETDPIPSKKLTEHLKNPDFFDVDKYPKAYFKLQKFQPIKDQTWLATGLLEIKGIAKNVEIEVHQTDDGWSTELSIDRFDWNIAYEGSWADRTLVDREILLQVKLKLQDSSPPAPNAQKDLMAH